MPDPSCVPHSGPSPVVVAHIATRLSEARPISGRVRRALRAPAAKALAFAALAPALLVGTAVATRPLAARAGGAAAPLAGARSEHGMSVALGELQVPDALGTEPRCALFVEVAPVSARVAVGEVVTLTTRFAARCPQLLARRAAVVIVGGLPDAVLAAAHDALGQVVDAVAAAGNGRVTTFLVGDAPVAPVWATTPAELAAQAAALRALPARGNPSADAWTATVGAAREAIRAVPASHAPLVVVVDGIGLTHVLPNDARSAEQIFTQIVSLFHTAVDGAGSNLAVDLSGSFWLTRPFTEDAAIHDTSLLLVIQPSRLDTTSSRIAEVLAAFQAPIERWDVQLGHRSAQAFAPIAARPLPTTQEESTYGWAGSASGWSATAEFSATYRATSRAPFVDVTSSVQVIRASTALRPAAPSTAHAFLCAVDGLPSPGDCLGAPTPTPSHSPAATRPRPPTSGPTPLPTHGRILVRSRLFMPDVRYK